jgi:hypothetical protein
MANWCFNFVTFIGEKDNISKLEHEIDRMIDHYDGKHGELPNGFTEDTSSSDYIYDLEKCGGNDEELTIQYQTKWDISTNVLQHICNNFDVELKGTCMEEQYRSDTCGLVYAVRDNTKKIVIEHRTLSECGLDVDHMIEDSSAIFSEEFLDDSAALLAATLFQLYKNALEDSEHQIKELEDNNINLTKGK